MHKNWSPLLFVLALSSGLAVVGCNSGAGSGKATSGGASNGLKVVYIPKNSGNPYFNQVQTGFEKAGKQFQFDFEQQAPAKADPTSQLSIIQDEVQRGVQVLGITPNSPDAMNETLDAARKKGVIVVTVDADLTKNEDHRDLSVLAVDPSTVGPSQLDLLGKLTNYQGDFAILSATTDAPNQNAWIEGMKSALTGAKYSKMKLVATVYGDDDSQKSATEMEGLLAKYPNLKGVIAPTSVGLAAAAKVLEDSGDYPGGASAKNGGVVLTGLGTPKLLKNAVEKGVVQSFQLWSPESMGFVAGYVGSQLKQGKITLSEGQKLNVPGMDPVTIGPNNVIYIGPLLTFDKGNISKYDF
jgi:rhamnose transport system substrate-binding protein